jgi:hypothetical protein
VKWEWALGRRIKRRVAPPEDPRPAGGPDVLPAPERVKELVSQFGADRVKRMALLVSLA